MKIIDAHSGHEIVVNVPFTSITGEAIRIVEIKDGLFSTVATILREGSEGASYQTIPLIVRWLHPSFIFQRVAFFPS